jgi:hypothetical protein
MKVSFWSNLFWSLRVSPLVVLLLPRAPDCFGGSLFTFSLSFIFWLCGSLMLRLALGIILLQRLGVIWYHLDINIFSIFKKLIAEDNPSRIAIFVPRETREARSDMWVSLKCTKRQKIYSQSSVCLLWPFLLCHVTMKVESISQKLA